MRFMRCAAFAAFCIAVMTTGVFAEETDPAVESVESAEPAEAVEAPAAPPEPASLVAGLTVDEMMKAVGLRPRETYRGKVLEAITGDMLIVERNGGSAKVRVYGVDSPQPGQNFHQEARQFSASKFVNETVNVSVVATDTQGNPVVLLFNANGESLSHLLVAEGMAWWDRQNALKDALLRRLNAEAITNSEGLYSDPTALAPWDYRDSRGLPQVSYVTEEAVVEQTQTSSAPQAPPAEEPRTLAARGTMTESLARAAAAVPRTKDGDVDIMGLVGRHAPHIATDDSGAPLGLTATDISQIPYASEYGFRDGDIISNVNGIQVQSLDQIWELAPQFANVKQFQVEVIRNGQRTTIPINVN